MNLPAGRQVMNVMQGLICKRFSSLRRFVCLVRSPWFRVSRTGFSFVPTRRFFEDKKTCTFITPNS